MSKENMSNASSAEKEKPCNGILSKYLKKFSPVSLQKSGSALSLSSLSDKSYDSSLTDSSLDQKISLALRLIASTERREVPRKAKIVPQPSLNLPVEEAGLITRCNWITKSSGDGSRGKRNGKNLFNSQLFELLALSGLLMDFNWTQILKRKELLRELFSGFEPITVAKMGEQEITDIASDKTLALTESRVRCIVDNAKCILEIVRYFGSFSNYVWNYVNYKPVINKFRHPRSVPLRSPKAEAMSKDLLKYGFRFVGPVIVYSFMQAAGLTIDHLADCYRYRDCVDLAERPWRHV